MANDLEPITQLLNTHVDRALLTGLYLGLFNPERDKFFAAAYVPIIKEEYERASWNLGKIRNSHSLTLPGSEEKKRKYNEDKSYQLKDTDECVEEGIYIAYTISFIGCQYKREWYILMTLCYIGDGFDEARAKNAAERFLAGICV